MRFLALGHKILTVQVVDNFGIEEGCAHAKERSGQ